MRKADSAAGLIFLMPLFAAIVTVCLLSTPMTVFVAFTCYVLGIVSLVHAKLSLFRRGVWWSFGPSRVTPEYRRSYWSGYALIVVGILFNVAAVESIFV
ncbi:MAG: hypothetical protein Aurels2KO_21540 [Aureliella sp.]